MTSKSTVLLGFLLLAVANGIQAHEESNDVPSTIAQEYMQVWLGSTGADDSWSVDDGAGTTLSGDYSSLPLGGGVGQRMWGDRAQYGFEGGGLLSWQNDDIDFAGGDPGLLVAVDTDLLMVESFMGGVVAVRPIRWLRLYAAAGPSIAWGHLSGDDDDEDADPGDTTIIVTGPGTFIVIDRDENSSDFSFSGYARAGLEIELGSGFNLGASVRYAEHEFDFDSRGELKLDDVQWFLTLGGRF